MPNLKSKFCAKCGSEADSLTQNLCSECYFDTGEIRVPKKRELKVCSKCGAVLVEHLWVNSEKSNREVFAEQIKNAISAPENLRVVKVELVKIKPDGLIEVTFELNGDVFSKDFSANLKLSKELCSACKLKLKTDYKAKLQLRAKQDFRKFTSDALKFIGDYHRHIIKIKESRRGVDVHLRERSIALKIAHAFKQKFNCSMKESREQYGWDRTKNRPKYKSTIMLMKK